MEHTPLSDKIRRTLVEHFDTVPPDDPEWFTAQRLAADMNMDEGDAKSNMEALVREGSAEKKVAKTTTKNGCRRHMTVYRLVENEQ